LCVLFCCKESKWISSFQNFFVFCPCVVTSNFKTQLKLQLKQCDWHCFYILGNARQTFYWCIIRSKVRCVHFMCVMDCKQNLHSKNSRSVYFASFLGYVPTNLMVNKTRQSLMSIWGLRELWLQVTLI
jgi:hypothetical protein